MAMSPFMEKVVIPEVLKLNMRVEKHEGLESINPEQTN